MGLAENILSNGVASGVEKAVNNMMEGNSTNETAQSVDTILTTQITQIDPIENASWTIFLGAIILMMLYYIITSYYKKEVAEEIKARYLSLQEKGSRGPGAVLILFGDILFILTNGLIIAIVSVWTKSVLVDSVFPTTMMTIAMGTSGFVLLIFLGIATIFLLVSFYIYAANLIAGLITIKTIGLVLFLNPDNITAQKFLRLFFANQLFPLGLLLLIWFAQLVGIVFGFPLFMKLIAPIFVSLVSCVLLYVMYTLAWDWDIDKSKDRYRGKMIFIKKKIVLVGAAATGSPKIIAATAAANGSTKETKKHGIKKR